MSVDNDSYSNDSNQDINTVIEYVRQEFKIFLAKREDLVIKLGKTLEKEHPKNRENICREIKGILRQEIADKLISGRDVERYCLDEWKQKTKPKTDENDKLSFSQKVQESTPQLLVGADGNIIAEPTAIPGHYSNNNDTINNQESPNEGTNYKGEFCADNTIELESKTNDNNQLQSQVEEIKSELEARATNLDQVVRFFDTKFELPFEGLRDHMMKLLSKDNHIKTISFIAKVDLATRGLADIRIWKGDGIYDLLNWR